MINVKQIIAEREKEINLYFEHLEKIENEVDKTLFKIMKANILLMLYNLVEAIVSNSIDEIRDQIYNDEDVNFDHLKAEIRTQILKDLKKNISPENFVRNCYDVSNDIIKLSFKKEEISKGNIDRNTINELATIYGFNVKESNYNVTAHGNTLKVIKDKRNDLAHGTFSFAEIGKDYSLQDIEELKNKTIAYLYFVVAQIEIYIEEKEYMIA